MSAAGAVEVIRRGPWNATAALVGAIGYAVAAAADAPTGVCQAIGFVLVVIMRLAALRWGLQTPLPADVGEKLTSRRAPGDEDTPQR